jgi:hypothetical protein
MYQTEQDSKLQYREERIKEAAEKNELTLGQAKEIESIAWKCFLKTDGQRVTA